MLKILLTARIVLVIITIYMTSYIWDAWLILYLMAKFLALVNIMFIAWLLQIKDLRVDQWKDSCIRLT